MTTMQPLNVVTTIFNPLRYKSRATHYKEFATHIARQGLRLIVVEIAFGDREHTLTDRGNPDHIQLRTNDELWHKETAINIGVQHLTRSTPDWEYVAWVDADVHFCRDDWADETVQQLQHYTLLQPWSEALDTGPDGTVLKSMPSFGFGHVNGLQNPGEPRASGKLGRNKWVTDYVDGHATIREMAAHPDRYVISGWHHPGLSWAYTRKAWETMGGLYDESIVGHADTIMSLCMVGHPEQSGMLDCHPAMLDSIKQWARRAAKLRQNIGYVDGAIMHRFHGSKKQRQYGNRRSILSDLQFDPRKHLHRDSQGLLCLDDNGDAASMQLRDRIRRFFRARNEDGTEV